MFSWSVVYLWVLTKQKHIRVARTAEKSSFSCLHFPRQRALHSSERRLIFLAARPARFFVRGMIQLLRAPVLASRAGDHQQARREFLLRPGHQTSSAGLAAASAVVEHVQHTRSIRRGQIPARTQLAVSIRAMRLPHAIMNPVLSRCRLHAIE